MTNEEPKKSPSENFAEMMKDFGSAVAEIFNDPQLKEKAKEFGDSAVTSAKTFASRFKDEDVKKKFDDLGLTAKKFGDSVAAYFKDDSRKTGGPENTASAGNEATASGQSASPEESSSDEKQSSDKTDESDEELPNEIKPSGETGSGQKQDPEKNDGQTEKNGPAAFYGQNKQDTPAASYIYASTDIQKIQSQRNARITGYSFAIAWSIIFLIFFNFFNRYIAFYIQDPASGTWIITPIITESFNLWLPFVNASLLVSIVGNIILIVNDSFYFDNITNIIMQLFAITSASALLKIFPFDFTVMSTSVMSAILNPIIRIVLIIIIVGLSIGLLVRFIKFIVKAARAA